MSETHRETMKKLMDISTVREHMNRPEVKKGREVLKKRLELGLSQGVVVGYAKSKGIECSTEDLSRAEVGDTELSIEFYNTILSILTELEKELDKK